MKQRPVGRLSLSEKIIRDIKRKTRKQYSAEEKIRIVLDGLRGEDSIVELCRRERIAQSLFYKLCVANSNSVAYCAGRKLWSLLLQAAKNQPINCACRPVDRRQAGHKQRLARRLYAV